MKVYAFPPKQAYRLYQVGKAIPHIFFTRKCQGNKKTYVFLLDDIPFRSFLAHSAIQSFSLKRKLPHEFPSSPLSFFGKQKRFKSPVRS